MERLFDKVLVTGGAGYCGARLVPQMLARGYKVTVYDIMFFGNQFLPRDNPNLRIIDGDIRDTAKFAAAVAVRALEICEEHPLVGVAGEELAVPLEAQRLRRRGRSNARDGTFRRRAAAGTGLDAKIVAERA
jgi:nucleoside-diphosphate-sugar epimerase